MKIVLPTFDSPVQVILNAVGIAILLVGLSLVILGAVRKARPMEWRDLLLLGTFSIGGVFVPVFPLVWFALERSSRGVVPRHPTP
jgi:hypothetical protein